MRFSRSSARTASCAIAMQPSRPGWSRAWSLCRAGGTISICRETWRPSSLPRALPVLMRSLQSAGSVPVWVRSRVQAAICMSTFASLDRSGSSRMASDHCPCVWANSIYRVGRPAMHLAGHCRQRCVWTQQGLFNRLTDFYTNCPVVRDEPSAFASSLARSAKSTLSGAIGRDRILTPIAS